MTPVGKTGEGTFLAAETGMASFTWKGFASGQWGEAALWAGVLDGRGYTTAQALAVLPGFDPASGSDYLYIVAV